MTSLAASIKDCTAGKRIDTAEVWGSSAHAPSTFHYLKLFHTHFSFSYSLLASIRMGISGSASFQSAKKS